MSKISFGPLDLDVTTIRLDHAFDTVIVSVYDEGRQMLNVTATRATRQASKAWSLADIESARSPAELVADDLRQMSKDLGVSP